MPLAWLARMRESMACLTHRYSATRTVREYTEKHYLPAAERYRLRTTNGGELGSRLVEWRKDLDGKWPLLRFGELKVETVGNQHVFDVQVQLNHLAFTAVRIEIYADGPDGGTRQEMKRVRQLAGPEGCCVYSGVVSAARPQEDYTVRAVPFLEGAAVPLEEGHIAWQR